MRKRRFWKGSALLLAAAAILAGTAGNRQADRIPKETVSTGVLMDDDGYLLPDSSTRYLSTEEIAGLSAMELCYARNEIFARLGRKFKSQELMSYFQTKSWYRQIYEPENFPSDLLNTYENANIQTLLNREYELCPGGYQLDQSPSGSVEVSVLPDETEILYADSALEGYGDLLYQGVELPISGSSTETIDAAYFFLLDMDEDGTEELLVYGWDNSYASHWKLFTWRDGAVVQIAQDEINKPGNAGHSLYIMGGNCIVDSSWKGLVGYNSAWDRYITYAEGEIRDLRYHDYIEFTYDADQDETYISEERYEYTFNDKEISAEKFDKKLQSRQSDMITSLGDGGITTHYWNIQKYCYDQEPFPIKENGEWDLSRAAVNLGTNWEKDLDRDGVAERVRFTALKMEYSTFCSSYRLQVGDCELEYTGECVHIGTYGVELGDGSTLLVVYEEGPSDDPLCRFFRYEAGVLREIGTIPWSVEGLQINGDGTVNAKKSCSVIQTDCIEALWALDEDGELDQVEQSYYVFAALWENTITLNKPLKVYERMNKNTDTTIIQPQVVNFLYTNGKSWVYVQAEDGTGGWFKAGDLSYEEKNQLFSGLLYAD